MFKVLGTTLGIIAIGVLIALIMALPTMLLWNYLIPVIFGLIKLSFWQALALNLLFVLLFKTPTPSK